MSRTLPRTSRLGAALVLLAALALACERGVAPQARVIPSALPESAREAARRLPLDGAHNARDLGGYATADGQRVRWGVAYRSDALGSLSDEDVAYLARLGVREVVDFRSDAEREREPDRLPQAPAPRVVPRPIFGDALDPAELRERLLSGRARAADMSEMLVAGNRAFVTDFAAVYGGFLRDLADSENVPVLFHCTAGKDRAGFAAAALLLALGVPRDTVMQDYLLTNGFSQAATDHMLTVLRLASFFRTSPDDARPLFEARREYLQAAFDAIDSHYGSDEAYLRDGLGLDDATRSRLRANLLEP
ncbi:MAG TPA: tyrosine-protein phosphatase [Myxococcota bacterium]|nr:tyrosine-protein phosphatase [Myxococcota bacterium]